MTARAYAARFAALTILLVIPTAAGAQGDAGISIGPRLTFVRGASDSGEPTQRFSGAGIRFGGGKAAVEVAMDFRSGITGELTERIRDYPIQASLLLFAGRGRLSPYLLGGVGWYSQHVQRLTPGPVVVEEKTTRRMGYHAGIGAEVRVHRRIGFYGDYRYTFIGFGGDDTEVPEAPTSEPVSGWIPFAERLRMSHEGSMWTWGATFHF
jgi:opacity protein-like surface antigen